LQSGKANSTKLLEGSSKTSTEFIPSLTEVNDYRSKPSHGETTGPDANFGYHGGYLPFLDGSRKKRHN